MPNPVTVAGFCNICAADVRHATTKHHRGFCPVCRKETWHITAIIGFPWVCSAYHEDDHSACAACGEQLPGERVRELDMEMLVTGGALKLICKKCEPH